MPDDRSQEVQRFRETQGAMRVHVLTINTPFTPSQDRFVLAELPHDAYLFACSKCSPRVTIGYGQLHVIKPEMLRTFLDAVEEAADAWGNDAIPINASDGVTMTIEVADSAGYRYARMVNPPVDSPHARLLAAWTDTFPQVRRIMVR